MQTPKHMILLYVSNPLNSLKFYETILGTKAIDQAPTFAMLPFNDATILGLWIESGVKPAASAKAGATELGFHVEDRTAVDSTFDRWKSEGVAMVLDPTKLDFGYTFVGVDPDGHRLRVFTPEQP